MALELVRPYFRARVNALGFTEWQDGFGDDNIPESIIDKSYHLRHGNVSKLSRGGADIVYTVPITVSAFFSGYRDVSAAIDLGMAGAESIVNSCINIANYVSPIKIVEFTGFTVEPYDDAVNDNIVKALISFDVIVPVCINV